MIHKFFNAINDFLIAWGEHRQEQLKNRKHHYYY